MLHPCSTAFAQVFMLDKPPLLVGSPLPLISYDRIQCQVTSTALVPYESVHCLSLKCNGLTKSVVTEMSHHVTWGNVTPHFAGNYFLTTILLLIHVKVLWLLLYILSFRTNSFHSYVDGWVCVCVCFLTAKLSSSVKALEWVILDLLMLLLASIKTSFAQHRLE